MHPTIVPDHSYASQAFALISIEASLQAVSAAVAKAQAIGVKVNIAIVDTFGLPVTFARLPGAPLHSIELAENKAYTAASFGLATSAWPEALRSHSEAVQDGLVRHPRFVAFGGGLPILENGIRIGGIGVSGGSEQEDEAIALAGLQAIGLT